ncbi:MAG: DUF5060 domain-containing protein [Planctomycetota bacterium]
MKRFFAGGVCVFLLGSAAVGQGSSATVTGELKKWHRVTITFDGPSTSEQAAPNPFRDYRLNVTFTKGARSVVVPGFYAADGNAAETGASSGSKWRVHFVPDEEGTWMWRASFRTGPDVALSSDPAAGSPASFDGASGSFSVGPTDKTGRDHRAKGMLRYVGAHHLRFAQTGEYFLKGGADSPENFLAYADFDQTPATHRYEPHAGDWRSGDPTWRGGKGKNIIGALNYLAGKGMNSVYFLTMNVGGDGKDVWPWTSNAERYRFDVSKLDQWEIVFSHMDRLGIQLHVVTQETENDQLLDGGALGPQRKLYYRELVARFAHHLALVWNLGEENTNTDAQRKWVIQIHRYQGRQVGGGRRGGRGGGRARRDGTGREPIAQGFRRGSGSLSSDSCGSGCKRAGRCKPCREVPRGGGWFRWSRVHLQWCGGRFRRPSSRWSGLEGCARGGS